MDPITIAATILSATGLGDWLKGKIDGAIGEKAASKIIDVAKVVTGVNSPAEIVEKIQADNVIAAELRSKLIENEQEIIRLEFADRSSAREMYKVHSDMADKLAERVMSWNLPAIVLLLICNGLVIGYVKDATLSLAIGNIVGGSISCLWQERQQIIGFFFGSSVGSKEKSMQLGRR